MRMLINVTDAEIIGVEKGNADKEVERPVCAFTIQDCNSRRVKVLLKGELAAIAWENYLKDQGTASEDVETESGLIMQKVVTVSLAAYIREERESETVLDDVEEIIFSYNYRFVV